MDAETWLRMATALYLFWYARDHQEEGMTRLQCALDANPEAPADLRARAFMGMGNLAYACGDMKKAREVYTQALELRREIGDARGIASSLSGLGIVINDEGEFEQARAIFKESLATFRSLNDKRSIALSLANLGNALANLGDYDASRMCLEESVTVFRAIGDEINLSLSLNNLVSTLIRSSNFASVRPLLVESLDLAYRHHNNKVLAHSLSEWAYLAHREGDMTRAACLFGAADVLREELHIDLLPIAQAGRDAVRTQIEQVVGETTYREFYEQGRLLTAKQAVALALEPPS
jgi:tetratricopeptide (TPR) repeat protein